MSGLATVVSRIREDLNRGSDFDARIKRALEDAIFYYRAVRLGFNTKRKTFAVSAEFTSLTANWIETDYLTLERSDYRNPLIEKNFHWMEDERRDVSFSDEPQYFCIQNRQLRLYPPPDQTYSVQMSYLYHLGGVLTDNTGASLSASDSFSNAWLTEGQQLVRTHAQIDLLANYIDGEESIAKARGLISYEEMILRNLKRRANREQGAGVPEPFL